MTRTACVTGADRGLGLALANRLLEEGYRVAAGRLTDEEGPGLKELRERHGSKLLTVRMNVADEESVREAKAGIEVFAGEAGIDLLINNAAILGDIAKTVDDELDYEEMLRVYDVNALGPLRASAALLPLVLRSEGRTIANISSEAGSIGDCYRTGWFAYAMSKSALNMQTALLHNHVRQAGGAVLSVHPGWVRTHMQGKLDADATYTPDEAAAHIVRLVRSPDRFKTDKPAFVDLLGNSLPW